MIWGGRREGGSGLGTHVHPWLIHVNVWQNQYSIVKQNEVKKKKKKGNPILLSWIWRSFRLKVIKHTLFYMYTHICIAISTLTDMDTDKDGCVNVYTYAHMRV